MEIDSLAKEYYTNFDLSVLEKKLNSLVDKIRTLKSEKKKKVYYIELYATYIQLVEIFCINAFAVSDNNLLKNIFLGNTQIKEKIESRFFQEKNSEGEDFIKYIINKFVFADKNDRKDRTQQKSNYLRLVKESIEDYLKDREFLNSYKHGFRVLSGEKSSLSIGLTGGASAFMTQGYSSSISYYRKSDDKKAVLKCDIYFNWERVYAKSFVLLNIFENMRRVYLALNQEIHYVTFDDQKIQSKYGCFRVFGEVAQL